MHIHYHTGPGDTSVLYSDINCRRALAEYPEVARVESQAVCPCTVCRQYFLGNTFEFADLAPHLGSSPGLWAATAASYCPSRPGELPKLIATEYRTQPDVSPCT